MPQHYFIDERNRTRPTFPEPPGPTPVQREPYALSAFEKDADWLQRNPEQNPDPAIRTAPADTVMGMVPDPTLGIRSGAAKAAAKPGMFTGQGAPAAFSRSRTGAGQGGFGPGGDIMQKKQMYGTIDKNVAMTTPLKGEGAAVSVRTPGGQVHRVMQKDLERWHPQHGQSVMFKDPDTGKTLSGMMDTKVAIPYAPGVSSVRLPNGDIKIINRADLLPAAPKLQGGSGYYHPSDIHMFRR